MVKALLIIAVMGNHTFRQKLLQFSHETQCRVTSEQPTQDPKPCISFLQEGEAPPWLVSKPQSPKFLAATRDWKIAADIKEVLHFLHHTMHTQERADIFIWYDLVKRVIIVERPAHWEDNMED